MLRQNANESRGARAGIEPARLAAGDFEGATVDDEIIYLGFGCAPQSKKVIVENCMITEVVACVAERARAGVREFRRTPISLSEESLQREIVARPSLPDAYLVSKWQPPA